MQYVCGFMMSWDMQEFLLIRKTHPDWMKGKWNGIGGKIEAFTYNTRTGKMLIGSPGEIIRIKCEAEIGDYSVEEETPQEAMIREFHEETGIQTTIKRWHCFYIEEFKKDHNGDNGTKLYYFAAFGDETKREQLSSPTDEEVKTHNLIDVFWDQKDYIYNLPYIIHMIIYNMRKGSFYQLNPQGVNSVQ